MHHARLLRRLLSHLHVHQALQGLGSGRPRGGVQHRAVLHHAHQAWDHLRGLQQPRPQLLIARKPLQNGGRQVLLCWCPVLHQLHCGRDAAGLHDSRLVRLAAAEPLQQAGQRSLPGLSFGKQSLCDCVDAVGIHHGRMDALVLAEHLKNHCSGLPGVAAAHPDEGEQRPDAARFHTLLAEALPSLDEVCHSPSRAGSLHLVVPRQHRHQPLGNLHTGQLLHRLVCARQGLRPAPGGGGRVAFHQRRGGASDGLGASHQVGNDGTVLLPA
mmetsp:Transcript_22668/g.62941  ORF Transcript_22668/g.62941 Transcript_22668/m.62941 type:complete len:270 (-) Transcript_22668:28-837(-)